MLDDEELTVEYTDCKKRLGHRCIYVEGELINRMPRDRKYNCQLVVNA